MPSSSPFCRSYHANATCASSGPLHNSHKKGFHTNSSSCSQDTAPRYSHRARGAACSDAAFVINNAFSKASIAPNGVGQARGYRTPLSASAPDCCTLLTSTWSSTCLVHTNETRSPPSSVTGTQDHIGAWSLAFPSEDRRTSTASEMSRTALRARSVRVARSAVITAEFEPRLCLWAHLQDVRIPS